MATETLVVVSKIKDYVKGKGLQTSETAVDALSNAVRELLDKAAARAKDNGRQTIKDRDI
jgi:histone H3/H4